MILIVLLSAVLSGCSAETDGSLRPGTPEKAVQDLLEIRSTNSTSVAEYASFVSTSLAETLAGDSEQRKPGESPLPAWDVPERTKSDTQTAEVKVRWQRSAEHTGWPETNVFMLSNEGGRWMVVDVAEESPSDETAR